MNDYEDIDTDTLLELLKTLRGNLALLERQNHIAGSLRTTTDIMHQIEDTTEKIRKIKTELSRRGISIPDPSKPDRMPQQPKTGISSPNSGRVGHIKRWPFALPILFIIGWLVVSNVSSNGPGENKVTPSPSPVIGGLVPSPSTVFVAGNTPQPTSVTPMLPPPAPEVSQTVAQDAHPIALCNDEFTLGKQVRMLGRTKWW